MHSVSPARSRSSSAIRSSIRRAQPRESCDLTNPGDRAAGLGPGPRYWLGDPPVPGAAGS